MLKPIHAAFGGLDALGFFEKMPSGVAVEGGYLGILQNSPNGAPVPGIPVVDVALTAEASVANYPMLGLIDDSTTGSGYGTLFGSLVSNVGGGLGNDPLGPATHAGSNRISLWSEAGIFLTDVFDPAMVDAYGEPEAGVLCGTPLYWDYANRFWTNNAGGMGIRMATLIAIIDDVTDPLMSRVQPIPVSGAVTPGFDAPFMLFKFKDLVNV